MNNNRGLTLIEVVVSAVIVAIIAGILLSTITMHGNVLNEGTAFSKNLRNVNAVEDIISRKVRMASVVMGMDEAWVRSPGGFSARDVNSFLAYDTLGAVIGGMRIQGSVLQETNDTTSWHPIIVGRDTIKTSSSNPFHLESSRKEVSINMAINTDYRGQIYQMNLNRSKFACRN